MHEKITTSIYTREASIRSYVVGFALSLGLTFLAFFLVWYHQFTYHQIPSHTFLFICLIALSIIQLFVQITFFFHLGKGAKKGWNLTVFALAAIFMLILVLGSIWIMYHLNYNMLQMSPQQVEMYMQNQSSL